MTTTAPTHICRADVLNWFDGRETFAAFHQGVVDEYVIAGLVAEDFE